MRVAVIGLGSMGKRRIRLLKQYIEKEGKRNGRKNEKWEITGIDLSRERCLEVEELCNIETFSDLDKGLSKGNIDCALICSSPASHAELIHECLKRGLHVFTEMNLVNDRYHENQRLAGEKKRVLFLSSTFLYRKEIEFIKEKLQEKSFGGGVFLPYWTISAGLASVGEVSKFFYRGEKDECMQRDFCNRNAMADRYVWRDKANTGNT